MPRRNMKVWSCGRSVALSIVAVGLATLVSPTLASRRALQGLDLVEDLTAETIENMKADMSLNFLEAVLLEATVSTGGGDGGSNDAGMVGMMGGCSTPGVGGCSWPSYSLTDTDGVVHTCTVREDPPNRRAAAKKKPTGKDVSTALDPLEGRCATISHEYWSYKWCHRGEIIQFHDNKDGTTTKVFLGKHTRTEVKRARTVPTEPETARDLGESVRAQRESWPPTDHEKNVLESVRAHRGALGLTGNQGADENLGGSVRAQRESWPPTDHEKNVLESVRAHRGALGLTGNHENLGESVRAQRESWPPTDHEKTVLESMRAHREALGLTGKQGADEKLTEMERAWVESWPPREDQTELLETVRAHREAQREARARAEEEGADEESWISRVLKKKKKKTKSGSSSSGRKSKTIDPYEGINDFSEVAAVFDYYEGGDVCESTGDHRNVRTAITCCTTKMEEADGTSSPMAVLVSLQEVSTCSYLVQVCSRLLCPALGQEAFGAYSAARAIGGGQPSASGAAKSSMVPNAGGVLGILEELEACFPMKHEAWWSYRLCFSTGISQFHADLAAKDETGALGVVTDEFSLGTWDKSKVKGQGDDLIQPSEDAAGGAIVLEFTGGTECDLTGVLRSTTVHLKCATVQAIREILEDSTCHYRIVASSPLLCSHPALVPKVTSTRSVECVPEKKRRRMPSW